jgi:hypothetical protein
LDKDIKSLGTEIKVLDILVLPILFALVALSVFLVRRQKRNAVGARP